MRSLSLLFASFLCISIALGVLGCGDNSDSTGSSSDSDGGVSSDTGPDGGVSPDTGPDADYEDGEGASCEAIDCGENARCEDGGCTCEPGYEGDPDEGCEPTEDNPCGDIECEVGATCVDGECVCDVGFTSDGNGNCTPESVGDPADRTQDEVCERWNGFQLEADDLWQVEPTDTCDLGVLDSAAQRDAVARLNLYRWLVGLAPVSSNTDYIDLAQACATTLAAEDAGLTHDIPSDYECYTAEAAEGAGNSNLSLGQDFPYATVDRYIWDQGVESLGHRRWAFNPTMETTGFGHRGRYSCMYAVDQQASSQIEHVFYPPPGNVPQRAFEGEWSASSDTFDFGSDPRVSVRSVEDDEELEVTNVRRLGEGRGQSAVGFDVPGVETDVWYRVTVSNGGGPGNQLNYELRFVDCT